MDHWTKALTMKLPIQGTQITFKIDSGANTSVFPDETFDKLAYKPKLRSPVTRLDSPGRKLNCIGYFIATIMRKGKRFRFQIKVIKGSQRSHLLSRNVAGAVCLIKHIEEIKASEQISDSSPDEIEKAADKAYQNYSQRRYSSLQCYNCKESVSAYFTKSKKRAGSHDGMWNYLASF